MNQTSVSVTVQVVPISSPCTSNGECQYCCMEGVCQDHNSCETPFVNSFAFIACMILIGISIALILFWCCRKRMQDKKKKQNKTKDLELNDVIGQLESGPDEAGSQKTPEKNTVTLDEKVDGRA